MISGSRHCTAPHSNPFDVGDHVLIARSERGVGKEFDMVREIRAWKGGEDGVLGGARPYPCKKQPPAVCMTTTCVTWCGVLSGTGLSQHPAFGRCALFTARGVIPRRDALRGFQTVTTQVSVWLHITVVEPIRNIGIHMDAR